MLGAVIMDGRGLVDPRNKPFGHVLPLEIQIKIMFWVHCFYTMDKRKKVVQELKGLPKCDLTGFPQHLGEDRWWNQVVVRLHAPPEKWLPPLPSYDESPVVGEFFF